MTQTNPTCPHRPECDGCPLFELDAQASLLLRMDVVHQAMRAYSDRYGWELEETMHQPSPTLGWRNRARMVVQADGTLGFYSAGSREVITIDSCAVHAPFLETILAHLRTFDGLKTARFVDVRVNTIDQTGIVSFVVDEAPDDAWLAAASAHLATRWPADAVGLQINISSTDAILGGEQRVISGPAELTIQVSDHVFDVPPTAFFQANLTTLQAMHVQIRQALQNVDVVLDAFCGVGVHSIACAPELAGIVGYDTEATAVDAAKRNAARAERRAEFYVADDASFEIERPKGRMGVVVNPARAGLAQTTPARLAAWKPNVIVYVSCSATTFFRDAERLAMCGYQLDTLQVYDMMPRTEHVELLGTFVPGPAPKIEFDRKARKTHWLALMAGEVPRKATLPGAVGTIERLRKIDGASVVRIKSELDEQALRKVCRKWGHAIVGDTEFGIASLNFRYAQTHGLDHVALHRLAHDRKKTLAPAHLVSIFRLPAKLLFEIKD